MQILFYALLLAFFLCFIGWFRIRTLILDHLRAHHPVVGAEFVVPAPTVIQSDLEAITDDVHRRLREFIRSGRARALKDPILDRLMSVRRALPWVMGTCFVACAATSYLTRTP